MDRLTKRNENGDYYYPHYFQNDTCGGMGAGEKCNSCNFSDKVCNKLGEYEELEEQGFILKVLVSVPCTLGDDLYWIDDEDSEGNKRLSIKKYKNGITGITVNEKGIYVTAEESGIPETHDKVGSRWSLLTVEQAEQKLRELEGEKVDK